MLAPYLGLSKYVMQYSCMPMKLFIDCSALLLANALTRLCYNLFNAFHFELKIIIVSICFALSSVKSSENRLFCPILNV